MGDYIADQVASGRWREQVLPADVVGLARPITVFRARRKDHLVVTKWHGDAQTFCPPVWSDLAIGSGPCGLLCRACFLMLTFRSMRDPHRHLLYDNVDDFALAAADWLIDPARRPQHTLGLGIDRSDSLLYERVTSHARQLAPLFRDPVTNPRGCKLVLLTKSANVEPLAEIAPSSRCNVIITFSLNPEEVANIFEGKWPDGTRVTPSIARRLESARLAQDLGFEIRARLDPILPIPGWEGLYTEFIAQVHRLGIGFNRWTLGTYRQKNDQLDLWREKWGLLPMEWEPADLIHDGTHWHLPAERRAAIYQAVASAIRCEFLGTAIGLCKETHDVRKVVGLCNAQCNCLR